MSLRYPDDLAIAFYADNMRLLASIAEDREFAEANEWYPLAETICYGIATQTRLDKFGAAAIISALSPRNKWPKNIIDATNFALAARDHQPEPKASTFHRHRDVAWRIANGEPWENILTGRKRNSFIRNCTGDYSVVTCDIWHVRGVTLGAKDDIGTEHNYDLIERATIMVAAEFGLEPATFQALIWLVVKRVCGKTRSSSIREHRLHHAVGL